MSLVNLVSGGLDPTLMAMLAKEQRIKQFPLFIDYGQRAGSREWAACRNVHRRFGLPEPEKADLRGFGKLIHSGLTSKRKRLIAEAFTPGRNMLFLLMGAGYALQRGAKAVAIGLLDEKFKIFPDQTYDFITASERALQVALGQPIRVVAPLMNFSKADVVSLASSKGISGTYSCHAGTATPCGRCIACNQYK